MKSTLTTKVILSPNYGNYVNGRWVGGERTSHIKKLTVHHAAVVAPAENVANVFSSAEREASANYVIDSDGTIILCVPEEYRAWTSGDADNDNQAVTVEVCNSTAAPDWKVSDKALEAVINLGVDICRRHNVPGLKWTGDKNGTLTIHKMFQATTCPGPYLESKMPYIADEINKRLNKKEVDTVWYKVQVGAFKNKANAENLLAELKAKGYNGFIVEVDDGKPVAENIPTITVGSKVKIKPGAKSYEGATMASYVYNKAYTVDELKGDRVVLDKTGLCTAFHITNLILV